MGNLEKDFIRDGILGLIMVKIKREERGRGLLGCVIKEWEELSTGGEYDILGR